MQNIETVKDIKYEENSGYIVSFKDGNYAFKTIQDFISWSLQEHVQPKDPLEKLGFVKKEESYIIFYYKNDKCYISILTKSKEVKTNCYIGINEHKALSEVLDKL